jgi:hypothetical protein
LTPCSVGVLSTDDTGVRIDGPAPYRAEYSQIPWLGITSRAGLFHIGIGTSPPVFVTPILCSLFGVVRIISTPLNAALYNELHRRVGELSRCAACGCHVRPSAVPCLPCAAGAPRAGRSRGRLRFLVTCAGALALALYVGSYYGLSRRGYAEADQWNLKGFYYFSPEDSDAWRRKNYACVYLFWPLNAVDRCLGSGRYPASEPLWRLGK